MMKMPTFMAANVSINIIQESPSKRTCKEFIARDRDIDWAAIYSI